MLDRIQTHFKENKALYVGVGIGIAVTVTAGCIINQKPPVDVKPIQKMFVLGKARDVNQVMVNFVERSTSSRPVHLEGTNQYFNSISEAARETGHHISMISKNVNGYIPNVKGDVFKAV